MNFWNFADHHPAWATIILFVAMVFVALSIEAVAGAVGSKKQ